MSDRGEQAQAYLSVLQANLALRRRLEALERVHFGQLREVLELRAALSSTQQRCTELLTEVRAYRAVLPHWTCPDQRCRAFNGEGKERVEHCRACGRPRPVAA